MCIFQVSLFEIIIAHQRNMHILLLKHKAEILVGTKVMAKTLLTLRVSRVKKYSKH